VVDYATDGIDQTIFVTVPDWLDPGDALRLMFDALRSYGVGLDTLVDWIASIRWPSVGHFWVLQLDGRVGSGGWAIGHSGRLDPAGNVLVETDVPKTPRGSGNPGSDPTESATGSGGGSDELMDYPEGTDRGDGDGWRRAFAHDEDGGYRILSKKEAEEVEKRESADTRSDGEDTDGLIILRRVDWLTSRAWSGADLQESQHLAIQLTLVRGFLGIP
jgi:hypothetical protein